MKKEFTERLKFEGLRAMANGVGFSFVTGFEVIRATLVHPKLNIPSIFEQEKDLTPDLSLDSPFFPILQNSGDFFDGYWINMLGFNGLTALDLLHGKFTNRYIPKRVKASISTLFTVGAVTAVESGLWSQGGTNTLEDVPAGILGAFAFLGVDYISRKLASLPSKY